MIPSQVNGATFDDVQSFIDVVKKMNFAQLKKAEEMLTKEINFREKKWQIDRVCFELLDEENGQEIDFPTEKGDGDE